MQQQLSTNQLTCENMTQDPVLNSSPITTSPNESNDITSLKRGEQPAHSCYHWISGIKNAKSKTYNKDNMQCINNAKIIFITACYYERCSMYLNAVYKS